MGVGGGGCGHSLAVNQDRIEWVVSQGDLIRFGYDDMRLLSRDVGRFISLCHHLIRTHTYLLPQIFAVTLRSIYIEHFGALVGRKP